MRAKCSAPGLVPWSSCLPGMMRIGTLLIVLFEHIIAVNYEHVGSGTIVPLCTSRTPAKTFRQLW